MAVTAGPFFYDPLARFTYLCEQNYILPAIESCIYVVARERHKKATTTKKEEKCLMKASIYPANSIRKSRLHTVDVRALVVPGDGDGRRRASC